MNERVTFFQHFLLKMIELIWVDNLCKSYDVMMCVSGLLAWLSATIAQEEEYHDIQFNGYMVAKDKNDCSVLLICSDPQSQKKMLKILQQPPNEYKEKYIARVPSQEPEPVKEEMQKPDGSLDENTSGDDDNT